MRLGLSLSYTTTPQETLDGVTLAAVADEVGYDTVWLAEAYGTDAATVLGAMAMRTERIGLGSAIFQIPARAATMTAMTAATLDALSGGRFKLGLGVSGPQVSEGWYGVAFGDPVGRTEEYVQVVRTALGRRKVAVDGRHQVLPLPGGQGKPLVLSLDPVRREIPLYLAALGPKNVELLGRIADGWLGIFLDPESPGEHLDPIRAATLAAGREISAIDITTQVPTSVHDDPEKAALAVRPMAALYIGGMGSKKTNFYHRHATALGFGAEADQVQEKFMSRDYAGAAAAVPFEFLDATCLLGSPERIASRLGRYREAGVDAVNIGPMARSVGERSDLLRDVFAAATAAGAL